MAPAERPTVRKRTGEIALDGLDLAGTLAFGSGAAMGVAFGKFLLGGFLAVLAIGVFLRFKRRRKVR